MIPVRGSGGRDVLGNIGINDRRAHGHREPAKVFTKNAKKQPFGTIRSHSTGKATVLVLILQSQEIKRLKLHNAFLKMKFYCGTIASAATKSDVQDIGDHTTPKKRRYDVHDSEEDTADRLGSVTKNMFESPSRVKNRDIPMTPPPTRCHHTGEPRPRSSLPTPERHVLHAKLSFHDTKLPIQLSRQRQVANPPALPDTLSAGHISDDKIVELTTRLRDLERHMQELTFTYPSAIPAQAPPTDPAPKANVSSPTGRTTAYRATSPSTTTPTKTRHRVVFEDEDLYHMMGGLGSGRGSADILHEHVLSPQKPGPASKTDSQLDRGSPSSSADTVNMTASSPFPDAASGGNSTSDIRATPPAGQHAHIPHPPCDVATAESDTDDLHALIQGASSSALHVMHMTGLDQTKHRYEAKGSSYSSPDATLAAIRRGLASPPHISPLGEQGPGTPTVALSDLPLLQSKLSTWRKRYSTPSSSGDKVMPGRSSYDTGYMNYT